MSYVAGHPALLGLQPFVGLAVGLRFDALRKQEYDDKGDDKQQDHHQDEHPVRMQEALLGDLERQGRTDYRSWVLPREIDVADAGCLRLSDAAAVPAFQTGGDFRTGEMVAHRSSRLERIENHETVFPDNRDPDVLGKQLHGPGVVVSTGNDVRIAFQTGREYRFLVIVLTAELHRHHDGGENRKDCGEP